MKLGGPIFTGEFNARGMIDNLRLNLDDPKGTMHAGYKELIDETSDYLIEDLQEMLAKYCIDCGACDDVCPVEVIKRETTA